jgi:hypothetical protein
MHACGRARKAPSAVVFFRDLKQELGMRFARALLSFAALAVVPTAHAQFAKVDACSLLTTSQASTAIEAQVQQGQHLIEPSKGECIWTDGAKDDLDRRRVALSIMSQIAFDHTKASTSLKTERVSDVGDDAYYVLPKGGSPILNVRKGGVYFQIKVLNGLKVKPPLSADAVKARELVLGQAAAGKA